MVSGNMFNRTSMITALEQQSCWDLIVIGGGATGLGTALDSATRGYKTLLLEQHDFAKGTSSRSTKLIHGGVRYLAQGDLKLVYNALHERNILAKNAPHLVKKQSFVIPCYTYWDLMKYGAGLKLYDLLAGRFSLGRSRYLRSRKVAAKFPRISQKALKGGVEYFDGQFDDARFAVNLAQSAVEQSAVVLNYFKVASLIKEGTKVTGVVARDMETGLEYNLKSKVVINATGVFVDDILKMDNPAAAKIVTPSRGVHIVINKSYLESDSALMIPKTSDGRVLFAVPWHDHLVVGTTDTPLPNGDLEPFATKSDVTFILQNLSRFLPAMPLEKDILSVFAGLRPLAATSELKENMATKELSRDHKLIVNESGLITITGGKWTTYRKMAEDAIDKAATTGNLKHVQCCTETVKLHGCSEGGEGRLSLYGTDAEGIRKLMADHDSYRDTIVSQHPYTLAEVIWAIRYEMARTVEDVLARRLRLLFLDSRAAVAAAPKVAEVLKEELKLTGDQVEMQLQDFYKIAAHYQPTN